MTPTCRLGDPDIDGGDWAGSDIITAPESAFLAVIR